MVWHLHRWTDGDYRILERTGENKRYERVVAVLRPEQARLFGLPQLSRGQSIPYPKPASEADRIAVHLMEECGELVQALGKALRFGWENCRPDRPEKTNRDDILKEIDDVSKRTVELLEAILKEAEPEEKP